MITERDKRLRKTAKLVAQLRQLEAKVAALRLDLEAARMLQSALAADNEHLRANAARAAFWRRSHDELLDAAREYQRAFDADDADAYDARCVLWATIDAHAGQARG
jgi:hypothetical protein